MKVAVKVNIDMTLDRPTKMSRKLVFFYGTRDGNKCLEFQSIKT